MKLDRAGDDEIWKYARQNGFVIVTKDADFSDLSALHGTLPKVIWLRCGNQPTAIIESLIRNHEQKIRAFMQDEALSCLEIY